LYIGASRAKCTHSIMAAAELRFAPRTICGAP
jgi:hypothetical protein